MVNWNKYHPYDQPFQCAQQPQNYQQTRQQQRRQKDGNPYRIYDIFPYLMVICSCICSSFIWWKPNSLDLVVSPYPDGFDPNVRCVYHARTPGHSIKDFVLFKDTIQDFTDSGMIAFTPGKNGNHVPE